MKFFSNIYNNIKHKPLVNFKVNLFFLRNMLSNNLKHATIPHFFLPLKTLKLKFIKNNTLNFFFYSAVFLNILILLFFML